jgi:formate dehydrogenase subunit gamma
MRSHQDTVELLIQQHAHEPGGLLPLLHAIQDALGYIPDDQVAAIAKGMNRSRAEVHGVITYYHHFRSQPAAKHVVQICAAEACKACGADALMALAEKTLGCQAHGTSAKGAVTLEPVYCLGLCASSPALQVDDTLHARVSPEQLQNLLHTLERA